MDRLKEYQEKAEKLYGEYADWDLEAFEDYSMDELEKLDPKAKRRKEDLEKSNCYQKIDSPEVKILVLGFGGQRGTRRLAAGVFINTSQRTLSITNDYPFMIDQMEKIPTDYFKVYLKHCFIDFIETLNKISELD